MSRAAVAPRSAPANRDKEARKGSKVSGKRAATGSRSLRAKEEQFRRMNAELEAKTAELVKEAEDIVRGNISLLCDLESSVEHSGTAETHISTSPPAPNSQQLPRPQKTKKKSSKKLPAEVAMETGSAAADIEKVVLRMEQELDPVEWNRDDQRIDVIPDTAEDMGPEALVRFLKAKLRVTQEEMDRLCQELSTKERLLGERETRVKELTDQNNKLQNTQRTLQPELEKQMSISERLKHKCSGLEAQLASLRKEVEAMRGGEKKAHTQRSAVEVRLNRALEEIERHKAEIASLRSQSEDTRRAERVRVEELSSENKQLQRERNELMAAFKKQLKLIDILKRQKMHMEAAKLLSFTEEEFVKALDWQVT